MADNYYALTIGAAGASSAAYFSMTPSSNLQITQGGVSIYPTAVSAVMVNIYPQTLQISSPAGSMYAGVTIITSALSVDGRVQISPPLDVATVITLYGNGGAQIGQSIIDPGVSSGAFNFPVPDGAAFPTSELALSTISELVQAKKH